MRVVGDKFLKRREKMFLLVISFLLSSFIIFLIFSFLFQCPEGAKCAPPSIFALLFWLVVFLIVWSLVYKLLKLIYMKALRRKTK